MDFRGVWCVRFFEKSNVKYSFISDDEMRTQNMYRERHAFIYIWFGVVWCSTLKDMFINRLNVI